MTHSRPAVLLLTLCLWWASCGNAAAQSTASPSKAKQAVLDLNRSNTGQHVAVTVGQLIQITLQTIGGGHYDTPQVSSPAVRFESSAFKPAREQNPGGPTQVYRFRAAAEGESQVKIPHTDSNPIFTVTIRVYDRRDPVSPNK